MRVLLIDNYDSFTYNLAQYLGELGAEVRVVRNDALDLEEAEAFAPDAIVLSPGPGHPANHRDFGICSQLLTTLSRRVPTLGVCLGHQGLAQCYGGRVVRARRAMHGKASQVHHDHSYLFEGLPDPFPAARYHSLLVEEASLPDELVVTARSGEGEVMGLRHRSYPIEGVQFHPESVLTPHGKRLLSNFLGRAGR